MSTIDDAEARKRLARFEDELSAHRYLEGILWPDGPVCPRCGARGRVGKLNGSTTRLGTHKCYACKRSFSITRGTIFGSSHVPLHKWLQAIYLTDGGTKPMRPHHLQRIINVTFKTASTMLRKLEDAAANGDDAPDSTSASNLTQMLQRRRIQPASQARFAAREAHPTGHD